ncbi:MAG: DNA repair protein RecN [Clostridia bacterium]|nr:DNA repair protein RecN [Clostridia bacterium]
MLKGLYITNLALVEKANLEFLPGLNILTGETGAGKSMIIDAVNLVLGGRGSTELIRAGADKALVEGIFDLLEVELLGDKLAEAGLEPEEDGTLILSREISAAGKSICRINGRVAPLSVLKELGQYLIDIHGQHDHQSLLKPEKHLVLLDNFGDERFREIRNDYRELLKELKGVQGQLGVLRQNEQEKARLQDLLAFQRDELDGAKLRPGEDSGLEEEKNILASGEKLANLANEAYDILYSGSVKANPVLEGLGRVRNLLREIAAIDKKVLEQAEIIENAYYQLEDAASQLLTYKEQVEFNPERLEEVEDRLSLLGRLKKKYGATLEEVLAYREQIASQLEDLRNSEVNAERLEKEISRLIPLVRETGAELGKVRRSMAAKLEEAVSRELADLGMPKVCFQVAFRPLAEPGEDGLDEVEFLISPNPGEPLKPLAKIASGGEMARIMLAMKTILAAVDGIPTLIFDEVDTGVGGRAAQAVGEKLAVVGSHRQVICVTHSPQVASFADAHYCIIKEVQGERTRTRVDLLDDQQRVEELARMLGGSEITGLTRGHAGEMLALAGKQKGEIKSSVVS